VAVAIDHRVAPRQAFVLHVVIIQRPLPSTHINQVWRPRVFPGAATLRQSKGDLFRISGTSYSVLEKLQEHRRYGGIGLFVYAPARRIVLCQGKPMMAGSGDQHIFD
jgi:hypothetical protein